MLSSSSRALYAYEIVSPFAYAWLVTDPFAGWYVSVKIVFPPAAVPVFFPYASYVNV